MILLVLALAVAFGLAIAPAVRADQAAYHVFHGPNDGCLECGDK